MSKSFIALILFFAPILLVFQQFFITEIQYLLIALRYILIPLWIIFNIKKRSHFLWIVIGTVYFLFILILSDGIEGKPYIIFLNVISSICFFIFGSTLILDKKNNLLRFLRYGIDIINTSIIAVYSLALLNIYDAVSFFRDEETMLLAGYENVYDRFSIGNSIETPFMITSLLYIVILSSRSSSKFLLISVILNLITALISGSRGVVVLALILFVIELSKIGFKYKFGLSFIIVIISIFLIDSFSFLYDSSDLLVARFSDISESGSAIDRLFIFSIFFEQFPRMDIAEIIFGDGFNSSYNFIKNYTGGFRTPESVLIQLLLETGIIGTLIILPRMLFKSFRFNIFSLKGFSVIIIYLQLLFFLPIFTFMQIIFLLLGFISNTSLNKTKSV